MKLGWEADKHQQENSGAAVNVGSFLCFLTMHNIP